MTATCTAMIPACPQCGAIDAELIVEAHWESKDTVTPGEIKCPECKSEIDWKLLSRDDQEKIEEVAWNSYEAAKANEADYIYHQRRDV